MYMYQRFKQFSRISQSTLYDVQLYMDATTIYLRIAYAVTQPQRRASMTSPSISRVSREIIRCARATAVDRPYRSLHWSSVALSTATQRERDCCSKIIIKAETRDFKVISQCMRSLWNHWLCKRLTTRAQNRRYSSAREIDTFRLLR